MVKTLAFYRKSAFRKIADRYQVRVDLVNESHEVLSLDEKQDVVYYASYLATDAHGRTAPGDGTCSFSELREGGKQVTHHMARSTANTRGYNRAVSNLKADGVVSAEEMTVQAMDTSKNGEVEEVQNTQPEKLISEKQYGWLRGTVEAKKIKDSEFLALLHEIAPGLPQIEKQLEGGEKFMAPDLRKLTMGQFKALMGKLGVNIQ